MGVLLVLGIAVVIAAATALLDRQHTDTAARPSPHATDTPADASRLGWEIDRADRPNTPDSRFENLRAHGIDPDDPLLTEDERDELNELL